MSTDPVELTQDLIRYASVTPKAEAPIEMLANLLQDAGFVCTRVDRNGIANLYARAGGHGPVLGFNGHVDVVPVGDPGDWTSDPFGAEIRDGVMYGRGACDMKSGVAAFVAAAIDTAETCPGSLVITITGDEEGDGIDGTAAILDWMKNTGEQMDACIVGEPTCPNHMGEMIKIGRRGSMTARITARGLQGHAAYPRQARNPIHAMIAFLDRLIQTDLDDGTAHFDRTTLQVTGFDTGNDANNVIPASCRAMVNIRFNDAHTGVGLTNWLHQEAQAVRREHEVPLELDVSVSGESFVTPPGKLSGLVQQAVEDVTGHVPILSTTGGTSDARFIRHHCPVIECGLVGATMHQVDESVAVQDIVKLKAIYERVIRSYFQK